MWFQIYRNNLLNSMIHGSSRHRRRPSTATALDYFDDLLRRCTTPRHLQQTHTVLLTTPDLLSPFLAARLLAAYSHHLLLPAARTVFRHSLSLSLSHPHPPGNHLLWNSMIRAAVSHGHAAEALSLYSEMAELGVLGDGFTLPLVLRACASVAVPGLCVAVHCRVTVAGLQSHLHVGNEMVRAYSGVGFIGHARKVFDRMPHRTVVSWNVVLSGYAANCECDSALGVFREMEKKGCVPNEVTWTSLLSAFARCGRSSEVVSMFGELRLRGVMPTAESVAVVLSVCCDLLGGLELGKGVHGFVVKCGFDDYVFVKNSLVCVYGKAGDLVNTKRVFSECSVRNLVSWNALISCLAVNGLCDEAFEVFSQLQEMGGEAKIVPNVISWSAVIGGFASNGRGQKALELFREMICAGIESNSITIASVLSACSELAVLNLGKEIHGYWVRGGIESSILTENGLINMYAKSGSLAYSQQVFDKMTVRDLVSWNSMIAGYGMHGFGEGAVAIFKDMARLGPRPDEVTFIVLLSACSHAGLVDEGRRVFDQMISEFEFPPQLEHYACMVDLLGRAGLLKEANDLVKAMPMKPNAHVLGALLNSCRIHRNTTMAETIASEVLTYETEVAGSYMLLSNLYASCGRWDDSAKIRVLAKSKGLKKNPGQSWIEVKKRIYVFSASNAMALNLEELYLVLEDLAEPMKAEGYTPDKSFVLHDVNEEEKAQILIGHSEKLAIAFGHVNLPKCMPIRVMKNLRICGDCHSWTKIFSKVTGRQIIVRDGHRFHHFDGGMCSCKDYW